VLGDNCVIADDCKIKNSVFGDNVTTTSKIRTKTNCKETIKVDLNGKIHNSGLKSLGAFVADGCTLKKNLLPGEVITTKIKAIIFDWFGVCTVENWRDTLARELHQKLRIEPEIIKEKFKPLIPAFASAEISPQEFLEKFIKFLNPALNPNDFYYLFEIIPKVNWELLEFVLELKKKYSLFLLSNNFGPVFPNYEKELDFNKYFHQLFLSHQLKMSKTDSQIWERILPEINLQPQEILFIDNTEKYLDPAKKKGINTLLYQDNEQLKKEIKKLGL